jgi:hypothetical protein
MAFDTVRDASMMRTVMKAEFLDAETELKLAYAWRDDRDEAALHRLITAYMRLAISMAVKFKRYGAPMNDLIQEAGVGLMKAADKFDPGSGRSILHICCVVDQGEHSGLCHAQLVDGADRINRFPKIVVF